MVVDAARLCSTPSRRIIGVAGRWMPLVRAASLNMRLDLRTSVMHGPIESVKVDIARPQNGWITISIDAGDQHFMESVSYTPNDFMADLVSALCLLSKGNPDATAMAYCEPQVFSFRFSKAKSEQQAVFEIVACSNKGGDRTACFSIRAEVTALCKSFWRAYRRLASTTTPEQYEIGMRRPFPATGVDKLGELTRRSDR